jgi:hypothetical protein
VVTGSVSFGKSNGVQEQFQVKKSFWDSLPVCQSAKKKESTFSIEIHQGYRKKLHAQVYAPGLSMDSEIEDRKSQRYKPSKRLAKWNAYDNAIIRSNDLFLDGLGRGFFDDRFLCIDDRMLFGQSIVLVNVSAGRRREG